MSGNSGKTRRVFIPFSIFCGHGEISRGREWPLGSVVAQALSPPGEVIDQSGGEKGPLTRGPTAPIRWRARDRGSGDGCSHLLQLGNALHEFHDRLFEQPLISGLFADEIR